MAMAKVAALASFAARWSTAAAKSSGATAWSTQPTASASLADNRVDSMMYRSARARDDPQRGFGLPDLRAPVLDHDPEVAAQRELAASSLRVAVDGGDHRLGTALDGVVVLVQPLHRRSDLLDRIRSASVDGPEHRQVGADAEVFLIFGGEHDYAHIGIAAQFGEGRAQLLHEIGGDGIDAFAMHDNASDRAVAFDVDAFAHGQAVNRGMPPATSITAPVM